MVSNLWNIDTEKKFFVSAMENFLTVQQLFYAINNEFYAYIPRSSPAQNQVLQSRNSAIGFYTEKWCKELLDPIAQELKLYAINNVVCEEIALPNRSGADLALCTKDGSRQEPEDIKLLFEIKMSIVSNFKYTEQEGVSCIGDYMSHRGNPSLLRSDSMLKAIGKCINIRVSNKLSHRIPLVVLGNSPIKEFYSSKVDMLKKSGVIQGFWSLNPEPCGSDCIRETPQKGFRTIMSVSELKSACSDILSKDLTYFSSMQTREQIGKLIQIASLEPSNVMKADKFLQLIGD